MKLPKVLCFFVLCLVSTTTNFAQTEEKELSTEQKAAIQKNVEDYAIVLNLSNEQKTGLESITEKYAVQMIAVRDGSGGKFKKYRKVKAIRKNKDKEIEALLDKEQLTIYLEKQEEMQEKMRANREN